MADKSERGSAAPRGQSLMRSFLSRTDPLVWFFLLGGTFFVLDAWRSEPPREVIEITPGMAQVILSNRGALMGQELPPDLAASALDRFVEDEILVREAVARGLHLGDAKLRARLIGKMEFLLATEAPAPTEEDLADLRAESPDRYETLRRYSFEHRFFGDDRAAAEAAMVRLQSTGAMLSTGPERYWLGDTMEAYSGLQLSSVMGMTFLRVLPDLPMNEWAGPVRSGRGWHLVRMTEVTEPGPLPEEELQARLLDDWRKRQWMEARAAALKQMAQDYDIRLPAINSAQMETTLAEVTE